MLKTFLCDILCTILFFVLKASIICISEGSTSQNAKNNFKARPNLPDAYSAYSSKAGHACDCPFGGIFVTYCDIIFIIMKMRSIQCIFYFLLHSISVVSRLIDLKGAFQPIQRIQLIWEKAKSPRYPCLLVFRHF